MRKFVKSAFKFTLFSAILFIIASCRDKQSEKDSCTIYVNLASALPLKEAVTSMDVIMLQDSAASHFPGNYSKVEWKGDSIFVLDTWKDPGLYLYNSEGTLLHSYTKRGEGPDEFVGIVDFNVTSSEIILLDTYATSQRIILDRDFVFQRKEKAEEQARHFFSEENSQGIWYDRGNVAYGVNKDKLVYFDGDKRISVLPIPQEIHNVTFASYNVFAKIANDTIMYLPAVEPKIYKCYAGKAEVLCKLDFGNLWPDFSQIGNKNNPLELMRRISEEGKIYSTNMLSAGKNLAITFYCKDKFYILMFRCDDFSTCTLLEVDKQTLESLGSLVAMTEDSLVFGEPGKLIRMKI